MSGPSAPTLPIQNRSTVTPAGGASPPKSGASKARDGSGGPSTRTPTGRTPKKSGANKQGHGSSRHKAWADFTPTPWDYVSTPWGPAMNVGGMPPGTSPYEVVKVAAGGGSKSSKKEGAAWPNTPTPISWGATPTPSGGPSAANFGFGGIPPPLLPGPAGLPIFPPGFAAVAQMAASAAAGAAAGAAAAAAEAAIMSPDGSPDLFREDFLNPSFGDSIFGMADAGRRELDENEANYTAGAAAYDSAPWNLQPGMPMAPGPTSVPPLLAGGLPSKGSALHGTGKCRPCAWFWKAGGCQSAPDCNYCHLCPEGELKTRKKLKVAAMRMGAFAPAKPGNPTGAARTLKLTSLV